MALSWSKLDVERLSECSYECVNFCRKTSSRASQSIAFCPPFPPAACWCALMTDASTIEPSSSTSICSALKTLVQTSLFDHSLKRLYTVFQGPKRSGRSRHGAPVLAIHITALMNSRSSRSEGRPLPRTSRGWSFSHSLSESSCRRILSVDQKLSLSASFRHILSSGSPPARGRQIYPSQKYGTEPSQVNLNRICRRGGSPCPPGVLVPACNLTFILEQRRVLHTPTPGRHGERPLRQ